MEEYSETDKILIKGLKQLSRSRRLRPSRVFVRETREELLNLIGDGRQESKLYGYGWLGVAALAMVVMIFSGGMVVATERALPTDWWYPAKVAGEEVVLDLAGEAYEEEARVWQVNHRLDELERLPNEEEEKQDEVIERFVVEYEELVVSDKDKERPEVEERIEKVKKKLGNKGRLLDGPNAAQNGNGVKGASDERGRGANDSTGDDNKGGSGGRGRKGSAK